MDIITVGGAECREALASYLCSNLPGAVPVRLDREPGARTPPCSQPDPQSPVILVGNVAPSSGRPTLAVSVIDLPPERLDYGSREALGAAEIALVQWGSAFEGVPELGFERSLKSTAGVNKVLIYTGDEGRERAFRKVLDIARSRLKGGMMPEDVPREVLDAVKREAVEGKMPCRRAQELAAELGVPVPLVGRALDLLEIKIVECQLGCF